MADNHHLLPLADYLYKLYKNQSLCDLSIITKNGTTVLAHKLVVAAFSDAIRTEVEKWKDLPIVSIVVDCETEVLKKILDFVYIGSCHFHKELFPLLQHASHSLQIPLFQRYLKEKGRISRRSLRKSCSEAKQEREVTKAIPNGKNLRSRRNPKTNKAYDHENFEWSNDVGEPDDDWVPGDDIPTVDDDEDNDGDAFWEGGMEVSNESWTSRRKGKTEKPDKLIKQAYVRLERIDVSVKQSSPNNTLRHTVKKSLIPVKERRNRYTRKNLTNLAKKKLTRNKKLHPLINHSKHSIEKIKHSMNNLKKKSPTKMLACKLEKLYEKHHKDIQVKTVGYSCKICKVWHKNISHIKFHINVKHRNMQPRKRKSTKKTKRKCSFEERKKKIERIKQKIQNCECFRCDRTYKLVRGLATHLVQKHKISFERAQKLTGYPKYFKYQNSIDQTCDECKMEFNTLNDFRTHCRIVHKKKRLAPDIPCTVKKCSQKFLIMGKLKEHLVKFHKQKNVSVNCRHSSVRESPRVDKHDITTRLQKQRSLLKDLSVSSKEKQVKRKKEESFIKEINKLSEITASQSSSCQRKKIKYNVLLPSKKYRCNRCPKSSVCRNKLIHKNHREIRHKKIFVSKFFASQLVLKKHICQSFSNVKFVNKASKNLTPKAKEDVSQKTNATHIGVARWESNVLVRKEMSAEVEGSRHSITNEHNSVELLSFQTPNITGQIGVHLSLLQDSALSGQNGLLETSNSDFPGSLLNQSNGKQKRCKGNQITCLKCGLSFQYYSSASLHFKKKHQKHHLGQRTIFSSVKKHVNLRSVLFSRKSFLKTSTFQLQFPEERATTCEICKKTFSHVRSLARHLQNTHCHTFEQTRNTTGYPGKVVKKKEEITCIDCKKTFTNLRNLATHLQNVHKYTFEQAREATGYPSFTRVSEACKKKITKCEKCSEIFPTMKDFKAHELVVHGIPCKFCGEKFIHLVSLKKHGVREHPENFDDFEEMKATSKAWILDEEENENTAEENYKCDNCDFSTRKLNFLTVHVMELHPQVQHHCPVCGYSFRSQYSVDLHMSKHHGEAEKKKPVCIFCSKKFLRKRFLRIHQFKAHGILHPDVKQYKCDVDGCNKTAYTATELRQHKRNHTAEKRFSCQQCDFICAHRHRLLRHVRSVHLQLKPALCESCGKSFTTEQHMKEHIRRYHTNDYYELQCDYCSFQCGVKNQLQTHVWHQHNMKMAGDCRQYYQCDRCPYQTPLKCKFNNHMNGHNNIRNYVCDQCDAKFVTSSTLRTHKQWKHSSKEEDKICSHCGYKTKTSNKLNEHIRVQHQLKGVKPYHCTYCDFKCATGGNCRKHIMAKHKDLPVRYTCDTEYLEFARMARKEGNTNPLIVHTASFTDNQIAQSPATFTQIVPNFEQLPPADHLMFDPVRYEKL